jgi:hypothetical protein
MQNVMKYYISSRNVAYILNQKVYFCFDNNLSQCMLIEGGSESQTTNGTLAKDLKMEELWEAPSTWTGNAGKEETGNAGNEEAGNFGNEETEINKETESTESNRTEDEETEIKQETEGTESYRTGNSGNGETEIKQETEGIYAMAYSVIFKEEHGQVKEEVTEEQGGIDHQINEGEDPATNEGEDPATNEGEDPGTIEGEDPAANEAEDFYVVEMKYEEEEDFKLQVTTEALIFRVFVLACL